MPRPAPDAASRQFLRQIGAAIRELRREQGLLQEQLGARSGVTGSRIGEIERGKVNTSITRIHAIASALGVPPSLLLRRQELASQGERVTEETRAALVRAVRKMPAHDVDLLSQLLSRITIRP